VPLLLLVRIATPQTIVFAYNIAALQAKGVGRKSSRGSNGKEDRKIAKNDQKIALLSPFQGEANGKKDRKIAKKTEK